MDEQGVQATEVADNAPVALVDFDQGQIHENAHFRQKREPTKKKGELFLSHTRSYIVT